MVVAQPADDSDDVANLHLLDWALRIEAFGAMETAPVPPPIAIPDVTALEDSGGIDEELIVTPGKIITQTFFS